MTQSALYRGNVMHQRHGPRRHRLDYRLFMLLLDLDEVEALGQRLRFFSRNRFNLLSFNDRDYGDGSRVPLRAQIEQHLDDAGLSINGGAIRLLTMPRMFGFAFNPLSVYFCYRPDATLAAILYEVNNTFGERHSYLLPVDPAAGLPVRQTVPKAFHVSPFIGMQMEYAFRVSPPAERLAIAITGTGASGAVITAALVAHRHALTDQALLGVLAAYPMMTFKVVGGIMWEALKLWIKGVPLQPKPPSPGRVITVPTAQVTKSCI